MFDRRKRYATALSTWFLCSLFAALKWVKPRIVIINNPFFFELRGRGLRFYFMPEDRTSVIYVYDAR